MKIDFTTISGFNALLVLLGTLVSIVYSMTMGRKISKEQAEQTRKEWEELIEQRNQRIDGLQAQVDEMGRQMLEAVEKLGALRKQNEFLIERNIELQSTCALQSQEMRNLRAYNKALATVLVKHGVEVPQMAEVVVG